MRWAVWLAVMCAFAGEAAHARDPYQIKMIRWQEDYAYLAGQERSGIEQLKFIPLEADQSSWLTIGGEFRYRIDLVENSQFNLRPGGDFVSRQSRNLLHTDWHFDETLRVFVQLGYFDERGRQPFARSFDEGGIDLQQGFVDLTFAPGATLRAGRQEMPLGNQRLSDTREGFSIRRSFDAVRLDFTIADFTVTPFWGRPVLNKSEAFDDSPILGEAFYGAYTTGPFAATGGGIDVFWLAREKENALFVEGLGRERRNSFGTRLFGEVASWDYDLLGVLQEGEFGSGEVLAYAATADLGWTIPEWPWRPRLGLRTDIASGDSRLGDGELNSFDAPYPNPGYLSVTGAYLPTNAWTVFPLLTLLPDDATTVYLGASYMARLSKQDGFYYQQQNPFLLTGTEEMNVMNQAYGRVRWQPSRFLNITGTLLVQAPGTATRDVGGERVLIGSLSTAVKF